MSQLNKVNQEDFDICFTLNSEGLVEKVSSEKVHDAVGKNINTSFKFTRFVNRLPVIITPDIPPIDGSGFFSIIKDDELFFVEQVIVPGESGGSDVYWRQLSEREVLTANKLSHEFKQEQMRCLGSITHDFNNVLTVALGHSELVEMIKDPEKKEEHFKLSVEALKKIRGMLKKVLAYRHYLDFREKDTFDVVVAVREAIYEFKEKIPDSIIVNFDSNIEMPVHQCRMRIKEALTNLIENAVEAFDDDQHGQIDIKLCEESGYILITVKDNGRGMTEKTLAKVYEPFFSTHHNLKSAGLGLSLIKGIVDNMGGRVEIKSTEGQGCEVSVRFPADLRVV